MAKAFIEIASGNSEDGWHCHRNKYLGHEDFGEEVTICLAGDLEMLEKL